MRLKQVFQVLVPLLLSSVGAAAASAATEAARKWVVVSYNIHHGRGMDGKVDLARQAAVLKAMNPDVVALQEVDQLCGRSGKVDQTAVLAGLLGFEHHFFAPAMDFDGGKYGLAVISRHPFAETLAIRLDHGGEPRAAAAVTIEHEGRRTQVVSLHFDHQSGQRRQLQANDLLARLKMKNDRPDVVILAGDFNAERDEAQALVPGWTLVPKQGVPHTFTSAQARREIDFFFVLPAQSAEKMRSRVVIEEMASDHHPILLEWENDAKN